MNQSSKNYPTTTDQRCTGSPLRRCCFWAWILGLLLLIILWLMGYPTGHNCCNSSKEALVQAPTVISPATPAMIPPVVPLPTPSSSVTASAPVVESPPVSAPKSDTIEASAQAAPALDCTKVLSTPVFFPSAAKKLSASAKASLADLPKCLDGKMVSLYGYADSRGSLKSNIKYSNARANSVKEWLVANGVPADKIKAEGKGPTNEFGTTSPPNRRVVIKLE